MSKEVYMLTGIALIGTGIYIAIRKASASVPENLVSTVTSLDSLYKQFGALNNIDPKLIKAIAIVESNENPNAIGDDGKSFGLMQVSEVVGASYGLNKEDLMIPTFNIQAGSGFLAQMIKKYGLEGGIQAYNLGETKFLEGFSSPTYLTNVLKYYRG